MISRTLFARVAIYLLVASCLTTTASEAGQPIPAGNNNVIHGGNTALIKAAADTINLMGPTGSGSLYLGDFEAGWNNWTSADLTEQTVSHWQVSDYNQTVPGNLAAWCGSLAYAACPDGSDVAGGYGNDWRDALELHLAVHDPLQSATVRVTGTLQNDTEPGYDYTYLSVVSEGQPDLIDLEIWDGVGAFAIDDTFTYLPGELVGGGEVVVSFRVRTDREYSDADCRWPTAGACQVDDITVTVSQIGQPDIVSFTDFQDGTLGDWLPVIPTSVGDFAALWSGLEDIDPCAANYSQQVAFIDDGLVVPGTGGTPCISWCYGPLGYLVTTTGGLAGPDEHIKNSVYSPVMASPNAGYEGINISFDVFHHEELSGDSPGLFYIWSVRSADVDNSAGNGAQIITDQQFHNRNHIYYGKREYERFMDNVTDLMVPGWDEVQLQLGVYELGWFIGIDGADGYPTPYFDNVAVKVYPLEGPVMTVMAEDLAQDNFPESDLLDISEPGSLNVRFDAARNISQQDHLRNDPGDSVVVNIQAMRAGSVLSGAPELHYVIDANPLFNSVRTTATSGSVPGLPVVGASGPVQDKFAFDLPDTGTLYPGDVLHYYIRAGDDVAGDVKHTTLPADLTGYGDFAEPRTYDFRFIVRALPTIRDNGLGGIDTPKILVWDDSGDPARAAVLQANMVFADAQTGPDFDFYYTQAADRGVGNGVGGRTSGSSLAMYTTIIYAAGKNHEHTLSQADFNRDPGDDIGALSTWLNQGSRNLFLSGDGLASDLSFNQGPSGVLFLSAVLGVDVFASQAQMFINNQVKPLVITTPGNGVFGVNEWYVEGGCPDTRALDAVTIRAGAVRLAEFTDGNGNTGAYGFSAATLNIHDGSDTIISMPYDELAVSDPGAKAADYDRFSAVVLCEVLRSFGFNLACQIPVPVPNAGFEVFSVTNYPNPFNPVTRMDYTIAGPGYLSLKIYNVRGQLVRTLIDGQVRTSGHVIWDGTDDQGASVASGVYFSEAEMAGEVKVSKLALIK